MNANKHCRVNIRPKEVAYVSHKERVLGDIAKKIRLGKTGDFQSKKGVFASF